MLRIIHLQYYVCIFEKCGIFTGLKTLFFSIDTILAVMIHIELYQDGKSVVNGSYRKVMITI